MRRTAMGAVVLLSLAGCPAASRDPGPSTPPPSRAPAGGSITLAYASEPATLDPFTRAGASVATRDLLGLIRPGLYRTGPGGERVPWLLAREPAVAEPAPTAVTVDLRADAVWSDGRHITPRDLIFTWRRALGRNAVWSRDPYDRIRSVERLSAKRARITFTQPFTRWREVFNEVLPAHALRTAARRERLARRWPVSGGPFVMKRWRRGLDMVFERNPRAWPRAPELDRIRVVFVPDGTSALELLEQGKVDVLGPYLAPDWKRRARTIEGSIVTADRGGTMVSVVMNTDRGATRSAIVRRAATAAIDRRRVVAALIQSEGARLDTAPGLGEPALESAGDLSEAHDLLDRAGWEGRPFRSKDGEELKATFAFAVDDDIAGILARAVQRQVGHARMLLETVALERPDFETDWLDTDRFEMGLLVTRGVSARFLMGATGPPNIPRLADRRLDRALDLADRGGGATEAAIRFARLMPLIPLYDADVVLVSKDVEQVRASASSPFWNAHEWERAA